MMHVLSDTGSNGFEYSTQPRPSSDIRSNGFELLAGTITSCLQEDALLPRSPCSTSSRFQAVFETRWPCVVPRCTCPTFQHAMSDTRSKCVVLQLT